MDVFALRDNIIADYESYVKGFVTIKDKGIEAKVHEEFRKGLLWPDPMVQINPAFEPGGTVTELVKKGILHPECDKIFRFGKENGTPGTPATFHRHQVDALQRAQARKPYVVTTGTGSGKSLTYILPIVDHVLKAPKTKGVKAIIVYPMNALANSQVGELERYLGKDSASRLVTFERYTGQEDEEKRQRIQENPPDILLTNYMMLELILTREREKDFIAKAQGLKFIVFDELHTYRGRQGSDVAMLIRRLRDYLNADDALCIGTSATLARQDSTDRQREVAEVASKIFGITISKEDVIEETLRRSTDPLGKDANAIIAKRLKSGHKGDFLKDPLSSWIEGTLGLETENGKFVRAKPRAITGPDGAAKLLAAQTGQTEAECADAIKQHLLLSYKLQQEGNRDAKAFAFRLHQFISRGGTPFVTLDSQKRRHITLNGQSRSPDNKDAWLFPIVFCRECGKEYLPAWEKADGVEPRSFYDKIPESEGVKPVYLHVDDENPWTDDPKRLPQEWFQDNGKLKDKRDNWRPTINNVGLDGKWTAKGQQVAVFEAPFRFCLECGVSYSSRVRSDYTKLVSLEAEARSSATTVLTQSGLIHLKKSDLDPIAKKLLSFTDNRQDASLQAGHFNDFTNVSIIRSALTRALLANPKGLTTQDVPKAMLKALDLDVDAFAQEPGLMLHAADEARQAMTQVLGYRAIRDLERGWRVTSPNLEQTGLLKFQIPGLSELAKAADFWKSTTPELANATTAVREEMLEVLCKHMMRELCIKSEFVERSFLDDLATRSRQRLSSQWAIDEDEALSYSSHLVPRSSSKDDSRGSKFGAIFMGPTSNFGQFVKGRLGSGLKKAEVETIILHLLSGLAKAGMAVRRNERGLDVPVFQLLIDQLRWLPGEGLEGATDKLRTPGLLKSRPNSFFVGHYRERGMLGAGLESREHTAQVEAKERQRREDDFREARLPLLFCSPTMELGVDIAQLNVVNMRNVPPTPANYAQRSGRAGRSGQPALVYTYCSRSSPHDQYFFRRRQLMVRGIVSPPAIDLTNEELIRSHVQAIWLKEADFDLGSSLADLVETQDIQENYLVTIKRHQERLHNGEIKARSKARAKRILDRISELKTTDWYSAQWLDRVIDNIEGTFEAKMDRWRNLVRTARDQADRQSQRILQSGSDTKARNQAERLQREANQQIKVLMNDAADWQGDFYSYRYFASEGFLPGYNFPRLPISAFIPGRKGDKGNFLNRPRFIAISEFGPRSVLYHEGSKYRIVAAKQPPSDTDEKGLALLEAKVCDRCGYFHPITDVSDPDNCDACREPHLTPIERLYRLENVVTKRAQHINSDEEERRRLGFDIRTGIRFNGSQNARILVGDQEWGHLEYGAGATIWRINLGEKRRKNTDVYGFKIDLETGKWANSQQDDDDEETSALAKPVAVVPFVQDSANSLIIRPSGELGTPAIASLQAALKAAIQAEYSMDDRELAAEALPDINNRRAILLYESSAGGAGVLRHLARDPEALRRVARRALELIHYDEQGQDLSVDSRGEPCAVACYDCLLSYMNQRDHRIVDRHTINGLLRDLTQAKVERSSNNLTRTEQLAHLSERSKWRSEKLWLELVNELGYALPTHAQKTYERLGTNPDFSYEDRSPPVLVYVDGGIHWHEDVKQRDQKVVSALKNKGVEFIRFEIKEGESEADTRKRWIKQLEAERGTFGGQA